MVWDYLDKLRDYRRQVLLVLQKRSTKDQIYLRSKLASEL